MYGRTIDFNRPAIDCKELDKVIDNISSFAKLSRTAIAFKL